MRGKQENQIMQLDPKFTDFDYPETHYCTCKLGRKAKPVKINLYIGTNRFCISVYSGNNNVLAEIWCDYSCVDTIGYFIHDHKSQHTYVDFNDNVKGELNIYSRLRIIEITGLTLSKRASYTRLGFIDKTKKFCLTSFVEIPNNILSQICLKVRSRL